MQHEIQRREFLATAAMLATTPLLPASTRIGEYKIPFSLGIVTYNIAADWDLTTILNLLKKTDIRFVEFRTTHKHGVEPSLTPSERTEVRKRCADAGIHIWGLGTVCEFQSNDKSEVDKHIESCSRFLQLGKDIGAKGVKVRPNGLPKDVPVEKTLEQIGSALAKCGKAAADLGQEVWVEVHGGGTSDPTHMKRIMEVARHPQVGICWNSNREDIVEGSVAKSFSLLKPWLKSCHINSLHSNYPWKELFKLLREAQYDRVTLCEIPEKIDPKHGEVFLRYYKRLWQEQCES